MTTFSPSSSNIPKPLRVCFSYAAYAKNLIHHLQYYSNIPVEAGLSDTEFSSLETSLNFTFPPDLCSILREGLPISPGFPNWRSSSKQQLHILINLPVLGIRKEVAAGNLWNVESWGDRPDDGDHAARVVERFLENVPVLVPIYGHFYIPTRPLVAGNPVFYVKGGDVKVWSFDIAGFFQRVEFCNSTKLSDLFVAPAWAARTGRRIEFWTDMAAEGSAGTGAWWSEDHLGGCLQEVFWRLRDGGWKVEDVREMMMMIDQVNEEENDNDSCGGAGETPLLDREWVEWRMRNLSDRLLSAGWSMEDVMESLGCSDDFHENQVIVDGDSCFEFSSYEKL